MESTTKYLSNCATIVRCTWRSTCVHQYLYLVGALLHIVESIQLNDQEDAFSEVFLIKGNLLI
jgi:hypothetical protein